MSFEFSRPKVAQNPIMNLSAYIKIQVDCSYSLVPASAGGPPLLPPPIFSCSGQRNRRRPVPVPVTGVRYNRLL